MSNRTMLEFNHDHAPKYDAKSLGECLIQFMGSGDPKTLPDGITYFGMRHHSEPCPLGDPPRGWDNQSEPVAITHARKRRRKLKP